MENREDHQGVKRLWPSTKSLRLKTWEIKSVIIDEVTNGDITQETAHKIPNRLAKDDARAKIVALTEES